MEHITAQGSQQSQLFVRFAATFARELLSRLTERCELQFSEELPKLAYPCAQGVKTNAPGPLRDSLKKKSGRFAAHREVYERVIDFGVAYSIFTSSAYRERDGKWRFPQEIATQDTAQE